MTIFRRLAWSCLALASGFSPVVYAGEPRLTLPCSVRDGHITDAAGKPVVLRVLNLSGMEFGEGLPYDGKRIYGGYHAPSPDASVRIYDWGFNAMRVPISWANVQPRPAGGGKPDYNEAYLKALDGVMRDAAAAGLPVILSMHHANWSSAYRQGGGMPAWLFRNRAEPQAAEDAFFKDEDGAQSTYLMAWSFLARRYGGAGRGLLGVDVYNEPRSRPGPDALRQRGQQLSAFYRRAAKSLGSTAPDLLYFYQDIVHRHPQLDTLPSGPNSVYSFHSYGPWSGERGDSLREHVRFAATRRTPIFIGEIGHKGGADWADDLGKLLGALRRENLSWAYWAYDFYEFPLYGNLGQGPLDQALLQVLRAGL